MNLEVELIIDDKKLKAIGKINREGKITFNGKALNDPPEYLGELYARLMKKIPAGNGNKDYEINIKINNRNGTGKI